jgi:hypothetical protein
MITSAKTFYLLSGQLGDFPAERVMTAAHSLVNAMTKFHTWCEDDVMVIEWVRNPEPEELHQVLREAFDAEGRPACSPLMFVVGPECFDYRHQALDNMAAVLAEYRPLFRGRLALVAEKDLQFGFARMLSVFCEKYGVTLQPFRHPAAAVEWLRNPATTP